MVVTRNSQARVGSSQEMSSYRNRKKENNLYPELEYSSEDDFMHDDGNISYESDHSECGDAKRSANKASIWKENWKIIGFFLLIFIAIVILLYFRGNSSQESSSLKTYMKQINNILKRNFPIEYERDGNTKAVLRLIGEKCLSQKNVEPYVILITGTKADLLADTLGDVFSNVTGKGKVDKIICDEDKRRQLLESEVAYSLSKGSKSVVLHGIDRLRGHAALYLHSLSDPDHAPFPSALILLTINLFFGSHPNCEDAISSYLLSVWDSDYIGEEQIRPILSRISSFLICLED